MPRTPRSDSHPGPFRKRIRIPWTPVVASVLVILSSAFAVQPVRDAATLADVVEVYLMRPLGYLVIAPVSNVLDMLTLLSVRQHIALVLGVIILFVIWRAIRAWREGATWHRHLFATGALVLSIAVIYVATAVLPRPMAALVADNANLLIVDFHSHTSASHDGRGGWSVERNRAWHRDGGYHAAYVTDHATVEAAEHGVANNPNPAAAGVTLLQGIEVTWTGEHVVILGAERIYRGMLTDNKRDVDEQGLLLASVVSGREPIVIWNHPRELNRLPFVNDSSTAGVRAIEVSNGAPDGMDKVRPRRAEIVTLAQAKNIALVGGSDNHGWGRTAPTWTLMRIFGWRGLQGDVLALRIERALRESRFQSTRVVERRVADPGVKKLALGLTVFAVPLRMLTTLSNEERVVWLIWIWLFATGAWWVRRRRTLRTQES